MAKSADLKKGASPTKKAAAPAKSKGPTGTPASRMVSPLEEFDRMMDRFFDRDWMPQFRLERPRWSQLAGLEARMPKLDIIDRDNEVVVRAEVPGIDRKDLDVSVTDSTITIKGMSRHEEKEENGDYYRCEISHGAFARTAALPGDVDADGAQAKFTDGILEISLPKVKQARRRKVDIK